MPSVKHVLDVYQELAEWYERRGQAQMRDRFLVLAADAALSAGQGDQAERLRTHLLQQNPHHLLRPYGSLAEALQAPDVQSYVADLRRSYSPETAQHLLESLRAEAGSLEPPPVAAAPAASAPPEPEPAKEAPEVLKFYRVQEQSEEVVPPPVAQRQVPVTRALARPPVPSAPVPAPAPKKPAAAKPPAPAKKPPRSPAVSPFALEPLPPVTAGFRPAEEPGLAAGYWVCSGLFVLLLLASLTLAVYTFARPFLPAEWFR